MVLEIRVKRERERERERVKSLAPLMVFGGRKTNPFWSLQNVRILKLVVCSESMLLTDLSKAFECILHDLLIAKLHAYGMKSVRLLYNYLNGKNKELKLTINIVPLKNYFLECFRGLSWGLYSLIFLPVIFF